MDSRGPKESRKCMKQKGDAALGHFLDTVGVWRSSRPGRTTTNRLFDLPPKHRRARPASQLVLAPVTCHRANRSWSNENLRETFRPQAGKLTLKPIRTEFWRTTGLGAGSATCWPYKTLYAIEVADSKPVEFRGSSVEDLRAFPLTARREAGHQVQNGREPDDWKPMNTVGRGAKEIRIRDEAGAFRVLYLAKFADAVYVLHCFQNKTGKTSKADVELAAKRYRELLKELGQ